MCIRDRSAYLKLVEIQNCNLGEVSYAEGICPNVEMLYSRELLTTEICRYPNNQDDMREFVLAVEKISDQSNSLKSLA